ncbi:MAG TPA: DUF397 domain-containing protein [Streptosporangiaceae bacterium]
MRVWRKSTYSYSDGTDHCVELAKLADTIGVRDSKNPEDDHLMLSRAAFGRLLRRIKGNEPDVGMSDAS